MLLDLVKLKQNNLHFPVLIREVLEYLAPEDNKTYVDCTFGGGSYSTAILQHSNANVIAIDRDSSVIKYAEELQQKYGNRFKFFTNTFSNITEVLAQAGVAKVDAIIADFGVSTMQISEAEKGFSIQKEGPLLMQMGLNKKSAFDFVNYAKEAEIATVLLEYGEETKANKIAKAIINARHKNLINTTKELKTIINQVFGSSSNSSLDKSTKSFQAIRIYVNDELTEISKLLNSSVDLLNTNGKIITVSFHSLEDRIVKLFFNEISNKNNIFNTNEFTIFKPKSSNIEYDFKILTKKVVTPKYDEVRLNRNSKSAKLRAIIKE